VINWVPNWESDCWCFDRRPLHFAHRTTYTNEHGAISQEFDFNHDWVWVLWAPRDEAKPHVLPRAWGFAKGEEWSSIRNKIGLKPVLYLQPGECDWVYLCDVIEACCDKAASLESLRANEHLLNLSRIQRAFTSNRY
jgi:hypothetical protein